MAFGGFENFEAFEPHDVDGERDAYYEELDQQGDWDEGRYDDDPNPYHGTYDEDDCAGDGEMPYENDYLYDDYCPEFDE